MTRLQYIFLYFICLSIAINGESQILSVHGHYMDGKVVICKNETHNDTLNTEDFRYKNLYHFQVEGDSSAIKEQLKHIKAFSKTKRKLRIRILEIMDSPNMKSLEGIEDFEHLSTLIINNCDSLKIGNVLKYIQKVEENYDARHTNSSFKKRFKGLPSVFYLNSLILKNQSLKDMGGLPSDFKPFKYLEELIIETPNIEDQNSEGVTIEDPINRIQSFINTLVDDWIIPDTVHYLKSTFPNLRFLGFKGCHLSSIPSKLKYKRELISLDLSGNSLTKIPECVTHLKDLDQLLSLNLSDNMLYTIDTVFLDNFTQGSISSNSKFSKYLFLANNQLSYGELLNAFNKKKYAKKFNTLTFECNSLNRSEKEFNTVDGQKVRIPSNLELIIELAEEFDRIKIARFMTGARRSETDYNPASRLFAECDGIIR